MNQSQIGQEALLAAYKLICLLNLIEDDELFVDNVVGAVSDGDKGLIVEMMYDWGVQIEESEDE